MVHRHGERQGSSLVSTPTWAVYLLVLEQLRGTLNRETLPILPILPIHDLFGRALELTVQELHGHRQRRNMAGAPEVEASNCRESVLVFEKTSVAARIIIATQLASPCYSLEPLEPFTVLWRR